MLVGCVSIETPADGDSSGLTVFTPFNWRAGIPIPMVVIDPCENPFLAQSTAFSVKADSAGWTSEGKIKSGMGAILLPPLQGSPASVELKVDSGGRMSEARRIILLADAADRELSGTLVGGDLIWDSAGIIQIVGDITIPGGAALIISPGTVVLLTSKVNIYIEGLLNVQGDSLAPVVFSALNANEPWGCLYFEPGSSAEIAYTLMTDGGGDASRPFGHSGSQPVIGGEASVLSARRLFIFDCPGKAFGIFNSRIELNGCLVQRCDTGGEFAACVLNAEGAYWLDIPSDDGIEVDDDNDGVYLNGVHSSLDTTRLRDCIFIEGKDDAIDHNGALAVITNCFIMGFDNEGAAASNANYIRIENCLVQDCEQGIEAGYGAPTVEVNHCTIRRCETGLRFGDWYYRACSGTLTVINSVSAFNRLHNVWNFVLQTGSPAPGAIRISYSMTHDSLYDNSEGCITGEPVILEDGSLAASSQGLNAGSDRRNMGRLDDWDEMLQGGLP